MRYVVFGPPYGTLEECIKHKKYHFNTLTDMLMFVADNSAVIDGVHSCSFNDLSIRRYCYDFERKTYIYLICTDRLFNENYIEMYGFPCAYKYFICFDDSLADVAFLDCKSNYLRSTDICDVLKANVVELKTRRKIKHGMVKFCNCYGVNDSN